MNGYKVRGVHTVDIAWSGAQGVNVDIRRNGGVVATTANDNAHTDDTGNKGGASYEYQVCEAGSDTQCSPLAPVVF